MSATLYIFPTISSRNVKVKFEAKCKALPIFSSFYTPIHIHNANNNNKKKMKINHSYDLLAIFSTEFNRSKTPNRSFTSLMAHNKQPHSQRTYRFGCVTLCLSKSFRFLFLLVVICIRPKLYTFVTEPNCMCVYVWVSVCV